MNSISPECQELKNQYDACFNRWFTEKYLKGSKTDECASIFKQYQECVMKAVKEKEIALWEVDRDILNETGMPQEPRSVHSGPSKQANQHEPSTSSAHSNSTNKAGTTSRS